MKVKREMSLETREFLAEVRASRRARRAADQMHAEATAQADAWNSLHPIGTTVWFWPGTRDDEARKGRTRSVAWVVGGHSASVLIEGCVGGIRLSHVEVVG